MKINWFSKGVFGILLLFVLSPISLYPDRTNSSITTFSLLFLSLITSHRQIPRGRIHRTSDLFVLFMTANCAIGILLGNYWVNAITELVPILEFYFCFEITSRYTASDSSTKGVLELSMILVSLRAGWQLLMISLGHSVVPPAYSDVGEDFSPSTAIGEFQFIRPIDPISGMHFVISFTLLSYLVFPKLSALVLTLTGGLVSIGLLRGEWIATLFCIAVVTLLTLRRTSWRSIKILMGIFIALVVCSLVFSGFWQTMTERLIEYTIEQFTSSDNSLQALRRVEWLTAWEGFESSPLFGHGLGSMLSTAVFEGKNLQFVYIHNYFLNVIASSGILGVLFLLVLSSRALRMLHSAWKMSSSEMTEVMTLCSGTAYIWFGLVMVFHPFYTYHVPVVLGTYFGLTYAHIVADSKIPRAIGPKGPFQSLKGAEMNITGTGGRS